VGNKRRVVVTGLGTVNPTGLTVNESWANILAGKSGIRHIEQFDVSDYACRIGGSVWGFDVNNYLPAKEARRMDIFIHYGMAAAMEAVKDSGLEVTEQNAERIGVAIGAGIGGLHGIEKGYKSILDGGPRKISPFFIPSNIINMISGNLSIMYGMKGPNLAFVTACTTGTHSIGEAGRIIEYGDADVMVAGGAESPVCRIAVAGFAAAKALSTHFNDRPTAASRPYDRDRDGFVMSEGAGVVVVEEREHALARGARIYGEIIGYGLSGDAYHITSPAPDGDGARRCMAMALKRAGIAAGDLDYINAHGTSTQTGDEIELKAVECLVGNAAGKISMSSTKSATGHPLGAAGAIEAIFSLLAIRDNVVPPTLNLDNPSVETPIDLVPHTARKRTVDTVLSNSFGFGGTNASLVMRRHS